MPLIEDSRFFHYAVSAQHLSLHAYDYFDEKKKKKKSNDAPKFKQAREFVHFHSFSSCLPFTSSITSGTQPPNTNILRNKNRNILSFVIYSTLEIKTMCKVVQLKLLKTLEKSGVSLFNFVLSTIIFKAESNCLA